MKCAYSLKYIQNYSAQCMDEHKIQKEGHAVPQVVERVEEVVVVKVLVDHLTVVVEIYQYNKFVGRSKMHLASSRKVRECCRNLIEPFIISELNRYILS